MFEAVTKSGDALIVHNTLPPVGTILFIAGNVVPENCVPAVGELLDVEAYAELFSVTGHLYGDSLDPTKFCAPDMRGRFPEGAQTAGGYNAPGLPDITGNVLIHSADTSTNIQSVNGAFYAKTTLSSYRTGGNFGGVPGVTSIPSFFFNASRSSSIYGGSSTVQPASIKLLPVIVYRSKRTVADN